MHIAREPEGKRAGFPSAWSRITRCSQALTVLVCYNLIWPAVDLSLSLRMETAMILGVAGFLGALVMAALALHGPKAGWLRVLSTAALSALTALALSRIGVPGFVQASGGSWLVAAGAAGTVCAFALGIRGWISNGARQSWPLSALLVACIVFMLPLALQHEWQNLLMVLYNTLSAVGITVIFVLPTLVLAGFLVEHALDGGAMAGPSRAPTSLL